MVGKLNSFLFGETKFADKFEKFIQLLILVSVVNFSIQTLPDLSSEFLRILNMLEYFSITIFSIEYVLRIFTSKNPFKFIFSFFGLIDLIAILPF